MAVATAHGNIRAAAASCQEAISRHANAARGCARRVQHTNATTTPVAHGQANVAEDAITIADPPVGSGWRLARGAAGWRGQAHALDTRSSSFTYCLAKRTSNGFSDLRLPADEQTMPTREDNLG
jgi:hypothetical protein